MQLKKFLASILSMTIIISAFIFNVSAEELVGDKTNSVSVPSVSSEPEYDFIEGIITDIQNYMGVDGKPVSGKFIVSIQKDENEYTAIIDNSTYFITLGKSNTKEMNVGDSIRVFYNVNAPMPMIYPPQYNAHFIALNFDESKFITISRFDENFTDPKNNLKLNISKDTEIVFEDGTVFDRDKAELVNPSRNLVVIYSVTTKSIPAQTTPEKIIIMYEKAVPPIYILTEEEKIALSEGFENADIVINGEVIEAPKAFLGEDGKLMVPVRAIAEKLSEMGYSTAPVLWFEDTQTVQIGKLLSMTIGKDAYSFARMAPVQIGAAPVIKNDRTYAPIDFLGLLPQSDLGSIDYYFENGKIIINTLTVE